MITRSRIAANTASQLQEAASALGQLTDYQMRRACVANNKGRCLAAIERGSIANTLTGGLPFIASREYTPALSNENKAMLAYSICSVSPSGCDPQSPCLPR